MRWVTFVAALAGAGGTPLHAEVTAPATTARVPAIVIISPYFGLQGQRPAKYADLYARASARGYAVVQVTMRGFGASGGCRDLGGPATQADAVAVVRWVAAQPWSDGHVAMWGLSSDGWAALMALAGGARLDAVVLNAPVLGAYEVAFHNGVEQQPFAAFTDAYYAAHALPPLTTDPSAVLAGVTRLLGEPRCADAAAGGRSPDRDAPFWRARELLSRVRGMRTPVLWSHGFLDANARPDNILPLWSTLRGHRRAWFGQFPHLTPGQGERAGLVGRSGFADEAFRFLDYVVRGAPKPADPPVAVQEGTTGRWRAERRWPPRDTRRWHVRLRPGSYRDAPGNKGEPYCTPQLAAPVAALDPSCLPGPVGRGAWTVTKPLRSARWIAGAARVTATLRTSARSVHLHAFLYDVDDRQHATLIARGATLARSGSVTTELYPQDWRIVRGHRLAVLLAGADDLWFAPGTSGALVAVRSGSVQLPVLRRERTFNLAGEPSASQRARTRFPLPAGVVSPG